MGECILVLGVGRDGTSMIAELIHQSGFFVGYKEDFIPCRKEMNPKGFWEIRQVVDLNYAILKENDLDEYSSFGKVKKVSTELFTKINTFYKNYYVGQDKVVIKDPRFALTFPIWTLIISNYHTIKIIKVSRNTKDHVKSLLRAASNRIIKEYIIRRKMIINEYEEFPVLSVSYDRILQGKDLGNLSVFLGIDHLRVRKARNIVIVRGKGKNKDDIQ